MAETNVNDVRLKLDTLTKRFDKHVFTKDEIIEIHHAWVEAAPFVVIVEIWFTILGTRNIAIFKNPQELNDFINRWDQKNNFLRLVLTNYQYSLVIVI